MSDDEISALIKRTVEQIKPANRPLVTIQLLTSIGVCAITIFIAVKGIVVIPDRLATQEREIEARKKYDDLQDSRLTMVERSTFQTDFKLTQMQEQLGTAVKTLDQINRKTP